MFWFVIIAFIIENIGLILSILGVFIAFVIVMGFIGMWQERHYGYTDNDNGNTDSYADCSYTPHISSYNKGRHRTYKTYYHRRPKGILWFLKSFGGYGGGPLRDRSSNSGFHELGKGPSFKVRRRRPRRKSLFKSTRIKWK